MGSMFKKPKAPAMPPPPPPPAKPDTEAGQVSYRQRKKGRENTLMTQAGDLMPGEGNIGRRNLLG